MAGSFKVTRVSQVVLEFVKRLQRSFQPHWFGEVDSAAFVFLLSSKPLVMPNIQTYLLTLKRRRRKDFKRRNNWRGELKQASVCEVHSDKCWWLIFLTAWLQCS
jgi:hypothetical protein